MYMRRSDVYSRTCFPLCFLLKNQGIFMHKVKKEGLSGILHGFYFHIRVVLDKFFLHEIKRSTKQNGLEPIRAALPLARLRFPKLLCALERHAVLTAAPKLHFLYPPPAAEAKLHPGP